VSGAGLLGIAGSAVRFATPYLYAALGETVGQLSGVLNLGLEGIMLMAAFSAFWATMQTGSLALGLLAAAATGGLFGLLAAFINVSLKAEQGISGIGLYLFGLGLSAFLFKVAIGSVQTVSGFPEVKLPLLSGIPLVGEVFFKQNVLVYAAFALVPLEWFVVHRTPFGLMVRAAGQNPQAADSLGLNVVRIRYLSAIAGGVLAGLAGASLSIALLDIFQDNLTNGMGFIAVALVFFGGWRAAGVLGGALLFSTVNALQLWIQIQGLAIPSDFALMLPYAVTILVLALLARRRGNAPAALGRPFERGEG
jgi:simple sugar transport system permease protein